MLHKSDTEDLFQETSPNPIKWAFLDEFSSDSCISGESPQVNLSFSNEEISFFCFTYDILQDSDVLNAHTDRCMLLIEYRKEVMIMLCNFLFSENFM